MGVKAAIIKAIADGEAPSPTYAAIGAFDAALRMPATVRSALADPSTGLASARGVSIRGLYDDMAKRGYQRVLADAAELAVRRKAPRAADRLVKPARGAATTYATGRHRYNGRKK